MQTTFSVDHSKSLFQLQLLFCSSHSALNWLQSCCRYCHIKFFTMGLYSFRYVMVVYSYKMSEPTSFFSMCCMCVVLIFPDIKTICTCKTLVHTHSSHIQSIDTRMPVILLVHIEGEVRKKPAPRSSLNLVWDQYWLCSTLLDCSTQYWRRPGQSESNDTVYTDEKYEFIASSLAIVITCNHNCFILWWNNFKFDLQLAYYIYCCKKLKDCSS